MRQISTRLRVRGARSLATTILLTSSLLAQVGAPDRQQSRHWSLPADIIIPGMTTVRQETITLSQPGTVFVQSDGNYAPNSWPSSARADVWITIDGNPASNVAVIEWDHSVGPQIHSYNVIGAVDLNAGTHVVRLMATSQRGTFTLGRRSNLIVFVNPAENVDVATTTQDSAELAFTVRTGGVERCTWGSVTHARVLRIPMQDPELPIFAMGSARVYRTSSAGDAMLGMFAEHTNPQAEVQTTFQAQFSVDDLWLGAEYQGPVYTQGVLTGVAPPEFDPAIVLGATEFPLSIHPASPLKYRVGSRATLVAMHGGLQVKGWAGNGLGEICNAICIGGSGTGCPPMETRHAISSTTITIPPGHDGRVLFAGKARCQGNPQDGAVRFYLEVVIDGQPVGSQGCQGLAGWLGGWDTTLSQRTLACSYLAAGANALSPGQHTVELVAWVKSLTTPPRTTRASLYDDAPYLIWID